MELGGPWSFYRDFWQAHGLSQLNDLLSEIGVNVFPGERIQIPVLVRNDSNSEVTVAISARIPQGWSEVSGGGSYVAPPRQETPLYFRAKTSLTAGTEPQKLVINAEAPGATIQPIVVMVHPDRAALPQ